MKKEELIKAIDSVQPDIHMKTRLQSKVLSNKKAYKNTRRFVKSLAALCLAAAVVFGAGLFNKAPIADNEKSSGTLTHDSAPGIIKAFIVVASAADAVDTQTNSVTKTLELNEEYPYQINLSVTDVRGKTEEEKKKILDELHRIQESYFVTGSFSVGRGMISGLDNVFVSECSLNQFKLNIENLKQLKCINVTNSSPYGEVVYNNQKKASFAPVHGHSVIVNADDFDAERCGFLWQHTDELETAVNKNPDLAFSTFDDTITFTAEYIDGSKATGVVELKFDSTGNATAVCKSYEYQKAGDDTR